MYNAGPCGPSTYEATDEVAKFDFPLNGANYSSNLDCTWTFTANDRGSQVLIDFFYVKTEACCDYLSVSIYICMVTNLLTNWSKRTFEPSYHLFTCLL